MRLYKRLNAVKESNYKKLSRIKKELLETNQKLTALLEISETATQSLDTEKILNDTLDKSLKILRFDLGYVRVLDPEKKNLVVKAVRGLSGLTTTIPLDSTDRAVGRIVFESKEPRFFADIRQNPEFTTRTLEKEGVASLGMVPIVSEGGALGVLAVCSKKVHRFTEREKELLSGFGFLLGGALENAWLYDAQLEKLSRLKRFFAPQIAELILSTGAEDLLKPHRREITVVFLDLRNFTAFAEKSEPEEVMEVLRGYCANGRPCF